jgi:hypothetical protein
MASPLFKYMGVPVVLTHLHPNTRTLQQQISDRRSSKWRICTAIRMADEVVGGRGCNRSGIGVVHLCGKPLNSSDLLYHMAKFSPQNGARTTGRRKEL